MTLRTRLALALAVAVAVGAVVFSIAARATVEQLLYDDVDSQLSAQVARTVGTVERDGRRGRDDGDDRDDDDRDRGPRFGRDRPGEFFGRGALFAQVSDGDGNVVLRTSAVDAIGGLPEPDDDLDDGELHIHTVRIDGERFRLAEARAGEDVFVQVAQPLSEVAGFVGTLQWVLLVASAIALVAAVLLGRWVARATLRPVEQMTHAAQSIASSPRELSHTRVEPAFPDPELAEFADAINDMLDSIDAADQHQRQFVADASHELRTPLTSLGGNATYLQRTTELDPEAREALDAVQRDIDRLARIADGLTVLARLDSTPVPQLEPVDVDELAREAIRRAAAMHPHHAFELHGSAGTHVLDEELARRIVGNLLDNAGRYTPDGSHVHLELDVDGDALLVIVEDDGPGIASSEHAHVLGRFHRGSNAAGVPGTGLGLAIVAEAAATLGGSLELADAPPHGLRCTVRLRSGRRTDG